MEGYVWGSYGPQGWCQHGITQTARRVRRLHDKEPRTEGLLFFSSSASKRPSSTKYAKDLKRLKQWRDMKWPDLDSEVVVAPVWTCIVLGICFITFDWSAPKGLRNTILTVSQDSQYCVAYGFKKLQAVCNACCCIAQASSPRHTRRGPESVETRASCHCWAAVFDPSRQQG